MDIILKLSEIILSVILSYILTILNIPLIHSILYGVFTLTIFLCLQKIYNQNKIIRGIKDKKTPDDSCLGHRSTTAIIDFLKEAKHDFYISGIINNSVINTFINNKEIIRKCCREGIKIHILFYVSDNEQNFDWYLKMLYGKNQANEKIKLDKTNYFSYLSVIKQYEVFRILKNNELLQIKRLDSPATTAFIARDIEELHGGKIQCLFYQYQKDSPGSPICQLVSTDKMFADMRDVIFDMWEAATDRLNVNYINNKTSN